MKKNGVTLIIPEDTAVLAERQRLENEREFFTSAIDAKYWHCGDIISLRMQSGVVLQIPRRLVNELEGVHEDVLLRELTIAVGGDALSVRSLDIDISIPGLLRDLFGFNIQRLGGRAKTEAKANAAKRNGAKGGRPKLQPA